MQEKKDSKEAKGGGMREEKADLPAGNWRSEAKKSISSSHPIRETFSFPLPPNDHLYLAEQKSRRKEEEGEEGCVPRSIPPRPGYLRLMKKPNCNYDDGIKGFPSRLLLPHPVSALRKMRIRMQIADY